ncbi:MAG TPA: 16S rRNA (uracil(1498)-N(3))-methyltransferase [Firmicutes bacterium]|uniref:Ribosomal RNA small subunit methyltransferase E n=1 Tax=Capillibacterium thermochitinicola TaxID=2699427 RepID=A0A8J6LJE4_9FIRM|nr:16S rRNA (uracil(1498)-N(3))-methyltransferase [Capillibacterium thermochitinicola]MBA2133771.1 16S rRNA (uracil(1498)-N(3))-methyltransferase [Capillibacterium thermochitinicola]HHW12089.1 16S rRNA (uracil(1498)-N(3))-methyltransferase [Bacillota bacterium]
MPKFFIEPSALRTEDGRQQVTITGEDAHHLGRVLRAQPGDRIKATDGRGNLYEVVLTVVTPETVRGDVLAVGPDQAEPALKITLFQSILKGEKMDWVLQKGTEIGITAFVPFLSARTIARPAPNQYAKKQERWQNIVTAAAKQSGRGLIPKVYPVTPWSAVPSMLAGQFTLVAWEGETTCSLRQALSQREQPTAVQLVIGPEGGFSPEEVAVLVAQGALSVSLGPRILRAETAGPLAAGLLLFHYGALEPAPSTLANNGR